MAKVIYVNFNNKEHKPLSESDRVIEKAMCIIKSLVIEKHKLIRENNEIRRELEKRVNTQKEGLVKC